MFHCLMWYLGQLQNDLVDEDLDLNPVSAPRGFVTFFVTFTELLWAPLTKCREHPCCLPQCGMFMACHTEPSEADQQEYSHRGDWKSRMQSHIHPRHLPWGKESGLSLISGHYIRQRRESWHVLCWAEAEGSNHSHSITESRRGYLILETWTNAYICRTAAMWRSWPVVQCPFCSLSLHFPPVEEALWGWLP